LVAHGWPTEARAVQTPSMHRSVLTFSGALVVIHCTAGS
jgi:hypothetical protein